MKTRFAFVRIATAAVVDIRNGAPGEAALERIASMIPPGKDVEAELAELATLIDRRRRDESPADLLDRVGTEPFDVLVRKHQAEPTLDRRELAIDWGETGRYRPRGANEPGVC